MIPGGKGANQAVAAARPGAEVTTVGRVGTDQFGVALRQGLQSDGINAEQIAGTAGLSKGAALIRVDASGENTIIVYPARIITSPLRT